MTNQKAMTNAKKSWEWGNLTLDILFLGID
jgi:hypothetical protein